MVLLHIAASAFRLDPQRLAYTRVATTIKDTNTVYPCPVNERNSKNNETTHIYYMFLLRYAHLKLQLLPYNGHSPEAD